MKTTWLCLIACAAALPGAAQITGGTCTAASLSGTYAATLNGRAISGAGAFTGSFQSNGIATFDGQGNAVFKLTANTNQAAGESLQYSGRYSILSTCAGTITISAGDAAVFTVAVNAQNKGFTMAGQDANYVYSGSGTLGPAACITASLSGVYAFNLNGSVLSGGSITGVADMAGLFQFDGQGNFSANWDFSSNGTLTPVNASGTYSVAANCTGTAAMTDSSNAAYTLSFGINNALFEDFNVIAASSRLMASGAAHSTSVNPADGVVNVASYVPNFTPAGSVFAVFGVDLATGIGQPSNVPLPDTLRTTTVTVNGESAPLFYVDPLQIDAQMPWDIAPGLATIVVRNGASSSAAAVYVPTAGPGISTYGNNRAVVVNSDGVTLNGPSTPANAGDEVVAYFTGGGPVSAKEKTGSPATDPETPVTLNAMVTVNGANAHVFYIGLTEGGIGLYQVNFSIPQLGKGSYPLQIIVNGQKSNTPQISVGN